MKTKTRKTLPVAVIAFVLVIAAFAWACTPNMHQMEIRGEPDAGTVKTGAKAIAVDGNCNGSCTDSGNRGLHMAPNASNEIKQAPVNEHQTDCDTADPSIGSTNAPAGITGTFSGSGTIPATTSSGAYIVCAGINPALLWDNYTVL